MFYVINFDVGQSRQANDSDGIVKRAKERFRNSEMLRENAARRQIGTPRLSKEFESVNKLFRSA